jgi:hypothetical protein
VQDELAELLDKQAITETIYRYAHCVDRRDIECLSSLFTPDATLHYGAGIYDGPAGDLIAYLAPGVSSPFLVSHHQVGNILIQLLGSGTASAKSYFTFVQRVLRNDSLVDEVVRARYLDKLIKQRGTWRFAERRVEYDWSHIAPAGTGWWWEQAGMSVPSGRE